MPCRCREPFAPLALKDDLTHKIFITLALAATAAVAAPAMAADNCAATIEANDMMQFNVKNVDVPKTCKSFAITLKHVGKMPKAAMGHNVVVSNTADVTAVATDGAKAGPAADYVKANDARVLAHTKVIGGGESTTVQLDVSKLKADGKYSYFCSFPGHFSVMQGTLALK